jgi:hypothetical protein
VLRRHAQRVLVHERRPLRYDLVERRAHLVGALGERAPEASFASGMRQKLVRASPSTLRTHYIMVAM